MEKVDEVSCCPLGPSSWVKKPSLPLKVHSCKSRYRQTQVQYSSHILFYVFHIFVSSSYKINIKTET